MENAAVFELLKQKVACVQDGQVQEIEVVVGIAPVAAESIFEAVVDPGRNPEKYTHVQVVAGKPAQVFKEGDLLVVKFPEPLRFKKAEYGDSPMCYDERAGGMAKKSITSIGSLKKDR